MSDGEMRPYVVRQGDYLTKLAWIHGFDAEEVWKHEKNKELAERRKDHNILAPGDVLYIPVKKKEGLPIQKGATNRYVAKVPKVPVKIVLQSEGKPLANEPYVLEGLMSPVEGKTGDDGSISFEVPVHTREVHIVLHEKNIVYPVAVGNLDPMEERAGSRMRLAHLGHYGWFSEHDKATPEDDRAAIESFQRAHGLEVTGTLDDATREALRTAHGS